MASEFERIARLQSIFGVPPRAVSLGIGDDCAILDLDALQPGASHVVWTIDTCVEGVHFRRDLVGWHDVGWRAFMAATSDLAAMGAIPIGALCAIAMPKELTDQELEQIAAGQAEAARSLGTAMVGGNLSRASEVSLTTTVIGSCAKAMKRSGARAGDRVVIAGTPGLAAAGLQLLLAGTSGDQAEAAIAAWRRPVARISEGIELAKVATAQIDTSDGLAQDAGHVAAASRVRIELDSGAIVRAELREVCDRFGLDAIALALGGGEDYALLATVPEGSCSEAFQTVGVVSEGEGVWIGARRVDSLGHDHFR